MGFPCAIPSPTNPNPIFQYKIRENLVPILPPINTLRNYFIFYVWTGHPNPITIILPRMYPGWQIFFYARRGTHKDASWAGGEREEPLEHFYGFYCFECHMSIKRQPIGAQMGVCNRTF